VSNISNDGGGKKDYNMLLEHAKGATEAASSFSTEAHNQMESLLSTGMRLAGMLAGMLGGILGSCGGGCGGI
jgi:hypothetical protein